MPSLKDVKAKIGGVQKTRQITKAMNMVAASRLRGAQLKMEAFRPYAKKFGEVLGSLAGRAGEDISPLLVSKKEIKNIHLVLCTSDRGLCGGFNANLISAAEKFIAARAGDEVTVSFTNFGKKGRDWARKNKLERISEHLGVIGGRFGFTVAAKCAQSLIHGFLSDRYDEVHVVFAEFVTMARQKAVVQQILPIPPLEADEAAGVIGEEGYLPEHICEPSAEALLSVLLTRNVSIQIYRALLETSTSEQAARMMAMDNATKACNDMLDALTLSYNKARQGAITKELMDIVGGAEALRG